MASNKQHQWGNHYEWNWKIINHFTPRLSLCWYEEDVRVHIVNLARFSLSCIKVDGLVVQWQSDSRELLGDEQNEEGSASGGSVTTMNATSSGGVVGVTTYRTLGWIYIFHALCRIMMQTRERACRIKFCVLPIHLAQDLLRSLTPEEQLYSTTRIRPLHFLRQTKSVLERQRRLSWLSCFTSSLGSLLCLENGRHRRMRRSLEKFVFVTRGIGVPQPTKQPIFSGSFKIW